MKRILVLTCLVAMSSGCGASLAQLRTRAALDLECPAQDLAIKEVDSATNHVTGCGKQAIYVELFNNSRLPTWLLNSEVKPARDVAVASGN